MKNVFFQRDNSFKIIKKLKEKMTWDEAVVKGHEIIRKNEIILNDHYAFPNKLACIDSNRRPKNGDKITLNLKLDTISSQRKETEFTLDVPQNQIKNLLDSGRISVNKDDDYFQIELLSKQK